MKLGEIKIEALKLMFASDGLSPKISELADLYSDENFKFYLASMNGSINRCLSVYEQAGVVPAKYVTLLGTSGAISDGVISFNLETLGIKSNKILRVFKNDRFGLSEKNIAFRETNGMLEIESDEYGEFIIKYIPLLERITDDTADTFEIDLPARYLDMMAHFIKGELYAEDEPSVASKSREIFEKFLSGLHGADEISLQVKNIYSQTEM